MAQEPPILVWIPGGGVPVGGGSNPPVYSQAGTTQLVEDQAYVDVVFGSIQTDDEWVFGELIVVNEIDSDPLNIWTGIVTDKTEAGFRIYLNGLPDSSNYYLHWAVSGVNIAPTPASTYFLTGPSTGVVSVPLTFTVRLPPSTTVPGAITITPSDGGAGGTFNVGNVVLSTTSASAEFIYTPLPTGTVTISTTNSSSVLSDPMGIILTVNPPMATTYTFTGPSSGSVSVASTDFTVALPVGTMVTGTVTITPSSGGGGGTFTPSTVGLTTGAPSATFTYTPASAGTKTISVTNSGGLTDPGSLTYTAVAPFAPTDIAGLKLWLEANAFAGSPYFLPDNYVMSNWPDASGNAYNFTSGAAKFKTNIVNGKAVVRFGGTSDSFLNTTNPIIPVGTSGYTIFLVFAPSSVSAGNHYVFGSGGATESIIIRRETADLVFYQYTGSGFASVPDTGGQSAGVFNRYTVDWNGSNIHMWKNGTLKGTSGATVLGTPGNKTYVGLNLIGGGSYFDGDIAEVLVYDSSLSSTDRGNIEAYLASKYAL